MIGDDRRKIVWRRLFLKDCCSVWDVIEQRPVGEKPVPRGEDNARFRMAIADEIGNRYGAALFQHQVQQNNFGLVIMKPINCLRLASPHRDAKPLPFKMGASRHGAGKPV